MIHHRRHTFSELSSPRSHSAVVVTAKDICECQRSKHVHCANRYRRTVATSMASDALPMPHRISMMYWYMPMPACVVVRRLLRLIRCTFWNHANLRQAVVVVERERRLVYHAVSNHHRLLADLLAGLVSASCRSVDVGCVHGCLMKKH
jgi:hypothetical protein